MTSLKTLVANRTVKALLVGYPGSGKTGSIAALINAGYKVRILDFDRNYDPLLEYVKPEFYPNVDIVPLYDDFAEKTYTIGNQKLTKVVPVGPPTAYSRAIKLLLNWKYTEPDGTVVDYGPVKTWGQDTILVLDSLTAMGEAVMWRVLHMANRLSGGARQSDWGEAQKQQKALLEMIKSKCLNCNVLVTAHLKMIEPRMLTDLLDDSTEAKIADKVKELMEKTATLVPTRLFPAALGRALPPEIGGMFPYIIRYDAKTQGLGSKRMMSFEPTEICDVKVPIASLKSSFGIEDGLLKVFDAVMKGV